MYAKRKLALRGIDDWGDGSFQAPRGKRKDGTKKYHKGIDYAASVGEEILAPVSGKVTKIGYAYADDLSFRYVEITCEALRHRTFYINPGVEQGAFVHAGEVIGTCQNISGKWTDPSKDPMVNHIHYEILNANGEPQNPDEYHA